MKVENGIARYDYKDEADLEILIKTGLVWKGGPKVWHAAIEYLRANPAAINDKVPGQVLTYLTQSPEGAPEPAAAGATLTPEEPEVAPEPTEPANEPPAPETGGGTGVA